MILHIEEEVPRWLKSNILKDISTKKFIKANEKHIKLY